MAPDATTKRVEVDASCQRPDHADRLRELPPDGFSPRPQRCVQGHGLTCSQRGASSQRSRAQLSSPEAIQIWFQRRGSGNRMDQRYGGGQSVRLVPVGCSCSQFGDGISYRIAYPCLRHSGLRVWHCTAWRRGKGYYAEYLQVGLYRCRCERSDAFLLFCLLKSWSC